MVYTRLMSIGSGAHSSQQNDEATTSGPAKFTRSTTAHQHSTVSKGIPFLDLPQEIIEKIFSFLTFKSICQLRPVCVLFDRIAANILNTTFQRLQIQLLDRFQDIKRKMPRRESLRRSHHLACESDIIETLHMRLTLLQMSLGKHIERKHCCFFPGEILDEVFNILSYIRTTPKLARPYKVTDELFDLSTMAMEYFKEKIEPSLPEIAYFSTDFLEFSSGFPSTSSNKYLFSLDLEEEKNLENDSVPEEDIQSNQAESVVTPLEFPTQSNMVLRKRIRRIKQGMKRYNSQLTLLRHDLWSCKRKTAEQQKQISEQQKQLAEQQKQTLDYANRLDENDKKNEEISRKFSTLLQELNKCKTELQYWRSKSPATPPFCSGCGNIIGGPQPEELEALMKQGVNPEGLGLVPPVAAKNSHAVVDELESNGKAILIKSDDGKCDASTSAMNEKCGNSKDDIVASTSSGNATHLTCPGPSSSHMSIGSEIHEFESTPLSSLALRNGGHARKRKIESLNMCKSSKRLKARAASKRGNNV